MNIEKPPVIQGEKSRVLDTDWYKRFEEIAAFQAYEYLDGDTTRRKMEKEAFLKKEKENPELDYPLLDEEKLLMKYDELLELKQTVLQHEENEVVKNVYRWRLNEKIAENRLLLAAATGDMRRFRRYSEFIYGKPSKEIFSYTINRIRTELETISRSKENPAAEEAIQLLQELPEVDGGYILKTPHSENLSKARQITEENLSDIINIPLDKELYEAEDIRLAFDTALQELSAEGWVAVINPNKTAISVNQEKKTVEIPVSRKLLAQQLKGLIAHEIGTHTARRLNGERTKLRLLGLGLDRYEGGEEGIATLREQALVEKVDDFSGLQSYLASSLAKGLDGKPRDFRETFTFLSRYNYVMGLSKGKTPENAQRLANESTWSTCVRTFRGTDSKTPGTCFTKDIIYRQGNIAVWETLERNSPEMHRWNIGKYDPSNPRHIWILDQLGITDEDLLELSK